MTKISERISYVGVNDFTKSLFEGLWPLPVGVSYNSYIVCGQKTALIDTAEISYKEEYIANVQAALNGKSLDYLVINHMEPDHSSLISAVREIYPEMTIVCNQKAVPMVQGYHGDLENMLVIKEGEELDLGGATLVFYMAPMVHWPETMVTYLKEEKTIFSGDAFGCFGAIGVAGDDHKPSGIIKDGFAEYRDEMIRYYSNIVGKYGVPVQNALKKLSSLEIARICSTHGPIWESEVADVIALYDSMSKYEPLEQGVCICYATMYGNTEKAALELAAQLDKRGVKYVLHNLCTESASYAYRDVFKFSTIALGSPTYNADIFPPAYNFLYGVTARQVRKRRFFAFGSFTWAGASIRLMNEMACKAGMDVVVNNGSFNQAYTTDKLDMNPIADILAE